MNNIALAKSYLDKARIRLKILPVLLGEDDYSDVVREAQEIVELSLKGMLRQIGIEPPKWHDVGPLILEYQQRFPDEVQAQAGKLAEISAWLRKEREFSFYGDSDFIPTEQYSKGDARRAIHDAGFAVQMAEQTIK
jgi:HEPN domain-containing protein